MLENSYKKRVREFSYAISDAFVCNADLNFVDDLGIVTTGSINEALSVFTGTMGIHNRFNGLFFALYMANVSNISINFESCNVQGIERVMNSLTLYPLPSKLNISISYNMSQNAMNVLANAVTSSQSLTSMFISSRCVSTKLFLPLGAAIFQNENIAFASYPCISDYLTQVLKTRQSKTLYCSWDAIKFSVIEILNFKAICSASIQENISDDRSDAAIENSNVAFQIAQKKTIYSKKNPLADMSNKVVSNDSKCVSM